MPRIRLSSRITDTDPGRPVAQALRELAKLTNEHDDTIPVLLARIDEVANRQLTPDEIRTALSPAGIASLTLNSDRSTSSGLLLIGVHADRVALAAPPPGTLFYETDRRLLYVSPSGAGWRYLAGILRTSLSGTDDAACPESLRKPLMTALDDPTMTAAYTASFVGLYGRSPTGVSGSGIDDTAYWIGQANHYGPFSDGWCRAGWSRYWERKLGGETIVDPAEGDVPALY